MTKTKLALSFFVMALTFSFNVQAAEGFKKSAGILVVGTQTEIRTILAESGLKVKFSEENPTATAAVAISNKGMKVYEHGAVEDILKLIGDVAQGGVVLTLKVGSVLWNLIQELPCLTLQVGKGALKAAAWVLTHTTAVVKSGVTFTVLAATEVLQFVGDVLAWIFNH